MSLLRLRKRRDPEERSERRGKPIGDSKGLTTVRNTSALTQLDTADEAITQTPSQSPPMRRATAESEPSRHVSQLGSAPDATPSGRMYARSIVTTARPRARGKVDDGRSTSPAKVEAESKPESDQ